MKAKEYYEKYFSDDILSITQEEWINKIASFLQDLTNEALELSKIRKSNTDATIMAALKEMDGRWNAVAKMLEKKYGKSILRRNCVTHYWNNKFEEAKNKEKNDAT